MNDGQNTRSVEHIFNTAADIESPDERVAYLAEACGDDRELRAQVEALLQHNEDAGSFLNKGPDELLAAEATQLVHGENPEKTESWRECMEPIDSPDRIGRLGSYEIIEVVGSGGMGVVLRAFDPKLSRIVAVKLLAPELAATASAVRRFLREARAAAAVSHDHVVAIYAIDDDSRPPLIAMEYVAGQSLQMKIDSHGALDVTSILRIGLQTAAGLGAAHRQGLVHRDVKPANILLENGVERVKLTDFGLARAVDDVSVTRTGQITGTPQYMSPEQALGMRVDHRTDLFSLGCVLYAMCTGRAAFRADSAVAVMHQVVHEAPRSLRDINEDIPDWLCEIVEKLMAKDPENRFQSADDVADLLGRHLAHLQQPHSAPLPERIKLSARRPVVAQRGDQSQGRNWLRRITIPAWIALLLFSMVFVAAIVEWTGGDEASSRGNGVAFYLLGVGFVLTWGACSVTAGVIRGSSIAESLLTARHNAILGSFTAVILLFGLFVWQWAELSNKPDRDRVLAFLLRYGNIDLMLGDPSIEVEFNGERIEVPADGRVTLHPEWPGRFAFKIHRDDGSISRGEFLANSGATIGTGVFAGARRVVISGPIHKDINASNEVFELFPELVVPGSNLPDQQQE